jgi:hypothetical protein
VRLAVPLASDSLLTRCSGVSNWIAGWKAKGWKTKDGEPVKNRDIIEPIDSLTTMRSSVISYRHVKGHSASSVPASIGDARSDALSAGACDGNDRADKLAVRGADLPVVGTPPLEAVDDADLLMTAEELEELEHDL